MNFSLTLKCGSGYTSSTFDRCLFNLILRSKCRARDGSVTMVNDLVVVPGVGAQTLYRGLRPSRRSFRNSLTALRFLGMTGVTL